MLIPSELKDAPQWVLWKRLERDGKTTKVPLDPGTGSLARSNDSQTWGSFRQAWAMRQRIECDGVGFVFTANDPFCGIDLDGCLNEGTTLSDFAQSIVSRLSTYTEISPSGTGLHLIVKAILPDGRRRNQQIEMYDRDRFFCITAREFDPRYKEIAGRQAELEALHAHLFPAPVAPEGKPLDAAFTFPIGRVVERASAARNGERFQKLWSGDTSDYDGDRSRADAALCRILAFWCNRNPAHVDILFRQSGLMREKWDAARPRGTYGEITLAKACATALGKSL